MLLDPIDIYCERTAFGLLDEPFNVASNLAFFIIAWLLWKQYKAMRSHDNEAVLLISLIVLIGMGSLTFHMLATKIAMLSDVIPIGLFVFSYLWISLTRLLQWNPSRRFAAIGVVALASAWLMRLPPEHNFNGSAGYFPCLVFLILIACELKRRRLASPEIAQASLWLAISLTFRTLDMAACPFLPIGVHFLWHICNGVVLYLLTSAVISPLQGTKDRVN